MVITESTCKPCYGVGVSVCLPARRLCPRDPPNSASAASITLEAFRTLQDALASCDPHNEHVWEDAIDADERAIMVSRSYKPGSVLDRVSRAIPDAGRR